MTHLLQIEPLLFTPGDRMSREEFLERWEQMPGLKFAELIDGVVYMPSPLSLAHGDRGSQVQALLCLYAMQSGVCICSDSATWLMLESAPQPDISLRLLPQYGGRTAERGKYGAGPPELVAEIVVSSRSYDLGSKLALYQRAGVSEYIAVLIEEQQVEWRLLVDGAYQVQLPNEAGVYHSAVFPGLRINEPALWSNNSRQLLDTLDDGLGSPEYEAFRLRLGVPPG